MGELEIEIATEQQERMLLESIKKHQTTASFYSGLASFLASSVALLIACLYLAGKIETAKCPCSNDLPKVEDKSNHNVITIEKSPDFMDLVDKELQRGRKDNVGTLRHTERPEGSSGSSNSGQGSGSGRSNGVGDHKAD